MSTATDHPGVIVIVLPDETAALMQTAEHVPVAGRWLLPESLRTAALPGWLSACDCRYYPDQDYTATHGYWPQIIPLIGVFQAPVVVLHWATRLPKDGLARLRYLAKRAPAYAAALSPLGAVHPYVSALEPDCHTELECDDLDRWLADYASGQFTDACFMLASCCVLLRDSDFWAHFSGRHSDQVFYQQLRNQGWYLLGSDQLFVDDRQIPNNLLAADSIVAYRRANLAHYHPVMPIRHALTEIASRNETPVKAVDCKPVQLHLAHSWGGGLGRWVEDYIGADQQHNNLVLRPLGTWGAFGQALALYRAAAMDEPLEKWLLAEPIISSAVHHYQYRQILQQIISHYNVERVMLSSLIGQSLDIFELGCEVTCVLHDFYPFCPVIVATYEQPCSRCDKANMQQCLQHNPNHVFFKEEPAGHFSALRSAFIERVLQSNVVLVAPSRSVITRYRQLSQALEDKPIALIEHGLDQVLLDTLTPLRSKAQVASARLRVVLLGSLTPTKGQGLLAEIIQPLTDVADLLLLGAHEGGEPFQQHSGVTVVARYTKQTLAQHLQDFQPDLGLLLSVVPETFSYTLSELFAAGIPVLATDLGAFSDRVNPHNGWRVAPTGPAVLAQLQHIDGAREQITQRRTYLLNQPVRSAATMTQDYFLQEKAPQHTPWRWQLARRSYHNPYQRGAGPVSAALFIDEQRPYRQILQEFCQYTANKIRTSPRLRSWQRQLLLLPLRGLLKVLR